MVHIRQEEAVIDCLVLGQTWVARAVAKRLDTRAVPLDRARGHLDQCSLVVHADTCPNLDNPLGAWRWVLQVAALRCLFGSHYWLQCSSPYVVAGATRLRPYSASAERRPLGLEGEVATALEWCLMSLGHQTTIVRPSLLYDDAPGGLLRWAIGAVGAGVCQVPSTVSSPTPVMSFARAIEALVRTRAVGVYHAACQGQASYGDIVRETAACLTLPAPTMAGSSGKPINLSLTSTARLGHWREVLRQSLADLTKGS